MLRLAARTDTATQPSGVSGSGRSPTRNASSGLSGFGSAAYTANMPFTLTGFPVPGTGDVAQVYSRSMLAEWWSGVELWVLGLAFPLQFALVIVILAPLCLVLAWLIDRIVDHTSALFGPAAVEEPPIGTEPPVEEERSEELVESSAR